MQAIEKRVAALERNGSATEPIIIIRSFVSPGHADDEITSLQSDDGPKWTRDPNEAEQEFIARVEQKAKCSKRRVVLLFANR